MKYVLVIPDGSADLPCPELGGRTPLEAAHIPNMDRIAREGATGLVQTIPEGMRPGSEVAILGILGYDPITCFPGRGPLEALAMGIELSPTDAVYRCNLVTTDGERLVDFTAGHITSEEAAELMTSLNGQPGLEDLRFYPGVAYRHIMVWAGGPTGAETRAPHDHVGDLLDGVLPRGEGSGRLREAFWRAHELLSSHGVNRRRRNEGHNPGNGIWPWGQGRVKSAPSFRERFGVGGSVIGAVDLVKGIAEYGGLAHPNVPGATGFADTDLKAKLAHALDALAVEDFVAVHVEAPDEETHAGRLEGKIGTIERIDAEIVGPLLEALPSLGPHRVLVLPDHFTLLSTRTHAADPVPFAIWPAPESIGSRPAPGFSEAAARTTGLALSSADQLVPLLVGK